MHGIVHQLPAKYAMYKGQKRMQRSVREEFAKDKNMSGGMLILRHLNRTEIQYSVIKSHI